MSKDRQVVIEAASATISTVSVSIRSLRVGPKQLTQAVFKQLIRGDLLDLNSEIPSLRGQLWGWVNYHVDGPGYRQFVAQFGDELARCPVAWDTLRAGAGDIGYSRDCGDQMKQLATIGLALRALRGVAIATPKDRFHHQEVYTGIGAFSDLIWRIKQEKLGGPFYGKEREKSRESIFAEIARGWEFSPDSTEEEVREKMQGVGGEIVAFWSEWLRLKDLLQGAPQLFIAV